MLNFLKNEGVSNSILAEVEQFRKQFTVEDCLSHRIPVPRYLLWQRDLGRGHHCPAVWRKPFAGWP